MYFVYNAVYARPKMKQLIQFDRDEAAISHVKLRTTKLSDFDFRLKTKKTCGENFSESELNPYMKGANKKYDCAELFCSPQAISHRCSSRAQYKYLM